MGARVVIKFLDANLGKGVLRAPGTSSLVVAEAQRIAAAAGHGCRAHAFEGDSRTFAAVWTRGKTAKQVEAAKRALEGAVM